MNRGAKSAQRASRFAACPARNNVHGVETARMGPGTIAVAQPCD